jgi:D-serine deaminase-like pyridoxal phosphate-dependent protein
MDLYEIDTPALVVDLDVMERNLRRAAEYARQHGLRLRPHTKTHKSTRIATRQLESGAVGLTVAKTGEAEVMLAAGSPELLVAYPVIGAAKLARLMRVARSTRLTVALDSVFAARGLSAAAADAGVTVGVLAEMDVGLGRVGVDPAELPALAGAIARLPGLAFEGIAFYPGHIKSVDETGLGAIAQTGEIVAGALDGLRRAGLEARVVSGGSTPTLFHTHLMAGVNEIRPGTYVFNDLNTFYYGACALEDCAASILVTVVSTARPGQMVVDGGSKTFSSDGFADPTRPSFGRVVEAPGCRFHRMNEEHGYIDVTGAERSFAPGDRVRIIPNHICAAVNLHEQVYGLRNGRVEETWKVEARGKLQ